MRDVERILDSIVPPDDGDGEIWATDVIATLRAATIAMLDKILWFLPSNAVDSIYEWGISLLDRLFQIDSAEDWRKTNAARLIISHVADRAGLVVTIKKP